MKLRREKIMSLEDIYMRSSVVELDSSLQGGNSSSQTGFFSVDNSYIPKPRSDYVPMLIGRDSADKSAEHVDRGISDEDHFNPPAVNAAWKGSFEIHNFAQKLDVQAYPPRKVSRKVYLVSSQMPDLLHFTLQPRKDVWPYIFNTDPPCVFDIGLYFGVGDFCSSREQYYGLLELMGSQDLSMQSHFDNVELLVFTSKQLPIEYQRMNRQLYLWGVFRSSKGSHCSFDLLRVENIRIDENFANKDDENQVVDMEIDMIGGKEVGKVDIFLRVRKCIARVKTEKIEDVRGPPGFSRSSTQMVDYVTNRGSHEVDQCSSGSHLNESSRLGNKAATHMGCTTTFSTPIPPIDYTVNAKVKREKCDDFNTPGFSRSLGAPPRFSKSLSLKEKCSSTKVKTEDFDACDTGSIMVMATSAACKVGPPGFATKPMKLKERVAIM